MRDFPVNPVIPNMALSVFLIAASFTVQTFAAVPVKVITPQKQPLVEDLPLTGTMTSKQESSLSPRISGLVSAVHVDAGHEVARGDVLIELDDTLAKLAVEQAAAALEEGRVALNEARRLDNEARNLLKERNIPETTALARRAEVEAREAALVRLQAEYRRQSELLDRHKIIAPFDGAITRKLTEAGEWVNTGTAVLNLISVNNLRLDVQAPQEYYPLLDSTTPVNVSLDAFPGMVFKGNIETTVPFNLPTVRTFLVRVRIDKQGEHVIPGMSGRAVFRVIHDLNAITLPRDAIVREAGGKNNVWVIDQSDGTPRASERAIEIGKTLENRVVIKSGVEADTRVIIRGNETLNEGQAVEILPRNGAN